jgi:acid phosphatase class B
LDEKHGLSLKAHAGWIIGEKYYFAALNSSIGQKVNSFYTTVAKEIQDIRDEAKRIAENKKSSLHAAHHDSDAIAASSVPTTGTATSTSLGTDAPLPSQGTYGEVDKNLNAPLESTAAPLK